MLLPFVLEPAVVVEDEAGVGVEEEAEEVQEHEQESLDRNLFRWAYFSIDHWSDYEGVHSILPT